MFRAFLYRRRINRKKMFCLAVIGIIMSSCIVFLGFLYQMRPILESMATARVSNIVNRIINEAVEDAILTGKFSYDYLITIDKDNEGKVTALKSNMVEFNRLQSEIMDNILDSLSEVPSSELSIPIGSLTGIALLSGRGPKIHIKMMAVGSPRAEFENLFTSAGINQTKHQIVLNLDVSVRILLPGFSTSTVVNNSLAVAETIIVGSVPNSYTYFDVDGKSTNDLMQDYFISN